MTICFVDILIDASVAQWGDSNIAQRAFQWSLSVGNTVKMRRRPKKEKRRKRREEAKVISDWLPGGRRDPSYNLVRNSSEPSFPSLHNRSHR